VFGLYVFTFVIGAAFLLLSLFGDALDADADGLDADFDGVGDLADVGDAHGVDAAAFKLFSLRSVVYAMFGFGSVGTVLTLTAVLGTLSTLAYASLAGVLSGALITGLFQLVKATEGGSEHSDAGWSGRLGTLVVSPLEGGLGQVLVERAGRSHKLLARAHVKGAGGPLTQGAQVLIIEVDRGVALVEPAGPDLLTAAGELPSDPDDSPSA